MADAPNSRNRTRTAVFLALVLLIGVLGWVVLFRDGAVERGPDLEVPANADPDANLGDTAEDLPPLDDEEVLEEIRDAEPETGDIVDGAVEDAIESATDPLDVDNAAEPENR